jgi:hypothetical protein
MLPYRFGNHNARNIYRSGTSHDTDEHIGVMFTPEMGRLTAAALNAYIWASPAHRDTALSRLARIAEAHRKHVGPAGLTSGNCLECAEGWPCPTYTWATTDRDPCDVWDDSFTADDARMVDEP